MLHLYCLPHPMEGEKVIRILHRDAFVALKRVGLFVVLLVLPLLVLLMVTQLFPVLAESALAMIIGGLVVSAYLLFIWLLFFFSMIDYILDIWVITDRRIIDVSQNGFFSRKISEQMLSKIQDITSDTHGFWPTIWKYGDLTVQTAAQEKRFYFEEIPDPEGVRDLLIRLAAENNQTPLPPSQPSVHEAV